MNMDQRRPATVPPAVDRAAHLGAEAASGALSRWLGREAHLAVNRVHLPEIAEAVEALGPSDSVVAACGIPLEGEIPGTILMAFGDRSGMSLVDALLGRPEGTATSWGPLEQSAAQETSNIVACAFLNALAEAFGSGAPLVPGPPEFRLEFAGSLLEFAVLDQASRSDRILLIEVRFSVDGIANDWSLVIVPDAVGLEALGVASRLDEDAGAPRSEP